MLALARRLGASALATGHYARVVDDGDGPLLAAPADAAKDQTYMLSALRPESLAALRFPLADLTKPQVRELAAGAGLPVAAKRESQDLCFLAGEGKRSFLARHARLRERPGEIVDSRGPGRSGATAAITTSPSGQRRGLGVAARRAALRAGDRRAPRTGSWSGPRDAAGHRSGCGFATPCCSATASAWTGSSCATARARSGARSRRGAGRHPELCARAGRAGLRRRPGPDRLPDGRRAGRRPRDDRLLD